MFSYEVVSQDSFLDMPSTTRLLYYDLGMSADDDGFVSPKRVIRMTGATDDDLKLLIAKRFVIPFKSGVIVIKHWKENNYIQKDRYKETIYRDEKKMLSCNKENPNVYELDTECIQNVRIGKDRLGKVSKVKERLDNTNVLVASQQNPELQEIIDYSKSVQFSLQGSTKQNRQYAYNLMRKKDDKDIPLGVKRVKWLIDVAIKSRGNQYAPQINDFKSLFYKWQDLLSYVQKEKNERTNRKPIIG